MKDKLNLDEERKKLLKFEIECEATLLIRELEIALRDVDKIRQKIKDWKMKEIDMIAKAFKDQIQDEK